MSFLSISVGTSPVRVYNLTSGGIYLLADLDYSDPRDMFQLTPAKVPEGDALSKRIITCRRYTEIFDTVGSAQIKRSVDTSVRQTYINAPPTSHGDRHVADISEFFTNTIISRMLQGES